MHHDDNDNNSPVVVSQLFHQTSQPFKPDIPQTSTAYSVKTRTHYSVAPISIDPDMYAVATATSPFVNSSNSINNNNSRDGSRHARLSIASSFSTICLSNNTGGSDTVNSPCTSIAGFRGGGGGEEEPCRWCCCCGLFR